MLKINLEKRYLKKVDVFELINHSLSPLRKSIFNFKKISSYLKKNGNILINEPEIFFF